VYAVDSVIYHILLTLGNSIAWCARFGDSFATLTDNGFMMKKTPFLVLFAFVVISIPLSATAIISPQSDDGIISEENKEWAKDFRFLVVLVCHCLHRYSNGCCCGYYYGAKTLQDRTLLRTKACSLILSSLFTYLLKLT